MRIGAQTVVALATLERCPHMPADVLARLLGLRSRTAAYQLLARLARAGLAEAHAVELGHVLGGRSIGLWSVTEQGRQQLYEQPHPSGGPAGLRQL
jgi:predicted ArsR family transcriptional regulator